MSVPSVPPGEPEGGPADLPPGPPSRRLGGFVTVLLVLVGIVLLLPGLCSLIFIGLVGANGAVALLFLLTFAIAAGGVMLIRYAIRNR